MRRSNFALRVPPTLLAEARKAAESEGVALNQLITLALAEKVSAMRTEEYFEERARRANPAKPRFHETRKGILLIFEEIACNSPRGYWEHPN